MRVMVETDGTNGGTRVWVDGEQRDGMGVHLRLISHDGPFECSLNVNVRKAEGHEVAARSIRMTCPDAEELK